MRTLYIIAYCLIQRQLTCHSVTHVDLSCNDILYAAKQIFVFSNRRTETKILMNRSDILYISNRPNCYAREALDWGRI